MGVARAVFRPGLGVSPPHRLSGEEKAVSGVRSPPTPAPHLQRERAWAEPRQRERDNRSPSGVGGPAFYLHSKPSASS